MPIIKSYAVGFNGERVDVTAYNDDDRPSPARPPLSIYSVLSYDQIRALTIMRDTPDREASEIAKAAGCSWEELYRLEDHGLITPGFDRLAPRAAHPVITARGRFVLTLAEAEERPRI